MALTESNYQGEIVKWEVERNFSRKVVTVVAVAALTRGTVLGIKTADSKYYPSVAGATDGTENAKAILLDDLAITTGKAVPVLARMAIIEPSKLVWDASYDLLAEKTAALAYLEANSNIVAATGV
jgi:hypothetical protein